MSEDDNRERMFRDRDREREDDRFARDRDRYGQHWDERRERSVDMSGDPESRYRDDPEGHYRSVERYGQGQSGYGAGRYQSDRAYRSQARGNQYYPGGYEERSRDRGADDRYTMGRGGQSWSPHDREDERDSDDRGGHYLGQSGQVMGDYREPGREPSWQPREPWGRHGSALPPGSQFDEQVRYGSQGYQGYRQPGLHRGKGPQGYKRSDERVREAVCEALTENHEVDATNIDVNVREGEVTLSGTVEDRWQKRAAEDAVGDLPGVRDLHNQIRIADRSSDSVKESSTQRSREYDERSNGQDRRHRA